MPKAYLAVLADGALVECSERELYARSSEFYRRVRPTSFTRIGRYTIVLGRSQLAVIRSYSDADTADAIAGRGIYAVSPQYRDDSNRDRVGQIASVRRAFLREVPLHPMRGLVEYDAGLELAEIRRVHLHSLNGLGRCACGFVERG